MKQEGDVIVVEKNRRRAIWALAIIVFMSLVSLALLGAGLLGGDGILWTPIALGTVGLLGFGVAAWMIVSTMRARWHLAVSRSGFRLHTPAYLLDVPWENVAGIATNEVNFREGCVLLFEDPAAVAQTARFLVRSNHPEVIASPDAMQARFEENMDKLGYHLGIPGRILELGPDELASLLSRARSGALWTG
ncbi:MAG: hypothetical protein PHY79_20850 [Anaerolineae bacterium]|nr:hypothetical protein [Anaerolineae bacterium]